MTAAERWRRYEEFEAYVDWTSDDARRITLASGVIEPFLPDLINDFYDRIERHPAARQVITGGQAQIERLKLRLTSWIRDLLTGVVTQDYVDQRWQVGWRHADIGLDAVYVQLALSRLRRGMLRVIEQSSEIMDHERGDVLRSLNTRLDLDMAIIEDAYQHEYKTRLQSAERLATIGQVTGGVAHELRNPLNVVKTSVYYLLNARNLTPEKTAEHLKRIERQVNLADSVIDALSNFARTPIPQVKSFRLKRLVEQVLGDEPLPSNIKANIDLRADTVEAQADPDQVRIVLSNLVRNACDAMPSGGTLEVLAVEDSVNGWVEITVRDTGVGISRENLSRVTEPLFSTKARGLGLGLAIARAILDKNRGQLRVDSELGRGSVFTIRLPIVHKSGQEQTHE